MMRVPVEVWESSVQGLTCTHNYVRRNFIWSQSWALLFACALIEQAFVEYKDFTEHVPGIVLVAEDQKKM